MEPEPQTSWLAREWPGIVLVTVAASLVIHNSFIDPPVVQPAVPEAESPRTSSFGQRITELTERLEAVRTLQELEELLKDPEDGPALVRLLIVLAGIGFIVLAGLATASTVLVLWLLGRRPVPLASLVPGRWGLWDVATVVALAVIPISINESVRRTTGIRLAQTYPLVFTLLIQVTLIAYIALIVWRKHGSLLEPLGLSSHDFGKNVLRGVGGYFTILPAILVAYIIIARLIKHFDCEPNLNPIIDVIREDRSPGYIISMLIVVALIVPVVEEIGFRGFLYPALRRLMPCWAAIPLSAAVFTVLHPLINWPQIMIVAVAMAYLRERTQSLVPCIALHCALNGLTVIMLSFMP